ncbi:phosphatase PAP2 family protein [Promicromonospora sukumoe]|uniref:phosphatase PAP2 family protein n=1 Tax=Promicromonospora sukumoe TaxID=88382 RepID=UPI0037C7240F
MAQSDGRGGTRVESQSTGALLDPSTRPTWRSSAVAAVIGVLVFAFLIWQVIVRGPFIAWDWQFHYYVDSHHPVGWEKAFLDIVASVTGERMFTIPMVGGTALYVARKQGGPGSLWDICTRRPVLAVLAGLATIALIGYGTKFGLGRTGPHHNMDVLHAGGQAFPSGHAANTFFTGFFILCLLFTQHGLYPSVARLRTMIPVVAVIVMIAGALMSWLDYHWLSDIPGGWLLGFIACMVALSVLRAPGREREPAPTPPAPSPEAS